MPQTHPFWRAARLLVIAALLLQALAFPAPHPVHAAATLTVTDPGDADTDGCSIDESDGCTLREAVAAAQPGDTIEFAGAVADEGVTLASQILLDRPLVIQGPSQKQEIGMAPEANARLFSVNVHPSVEPVVFKNLTLTGASLVSSGGGAADLVRGVVQFENVRFTSNQAVFGGALVVRDADVSITDSFFDFNSATDNNPEAEWRGGGAIFQLAGSVNIWNSTFANNQALFQQDDGGFGGGFYAVGGQAVLEDVLFNVNQARAGGGGFATTNASATLTRVTFQANTVNGDPLELGALYGGGLYSLDSTITVIESSLLNNTAPVGAAAFIVAFNGAAQVVDTSFLYNNAANNLCVLQAVGDISVSQSTFIGNSASDGVICAKDGPFLLTQSLLQGNAPQNKLIQLENVIGQMDNNTITGNTATTQASGAIWLVDSPEFKVLYNTIVINQYMQAGEDPACAGVSGSAKLLANIIVDNKAAESPTHADVCANGVGQVPTSLGYNRIGAADALFQPAASDQTAVPIASLQLSPLGDNGGGTHTFLPAAASPLVNQVPSEFCPVSVDQRGVTRPAQDLCEIGSVELQPTNQPPVPGSNMFGVTAGTAYNGQLLASDPEGDTFTFSLGTPPSNAQPGFDINPDGSFSYLTHSAEAFDFFGFSMTDSHGNTGYGSAFIMISPPSGPVPVANPDGFYTFDPAASYAWLEDPNATSLDLTFYFSDPISVITLAEPALVAGLPYPQVAINKDGELLLLVSQYGSEPQIRLLPFPRSLSILFESRVLVGGAQGDLAGFVTYEKFWDTVSNEPVTFQVLIYQDGRVVYQYKEVPADVQETAPGISSTSFLQPAPVAASQTAIRDEGAVGFLPNVYLTALNTPISVSAERGLLSNDHSYGDTAAATLGTAPQHGTVEIQPDGSFTYTPAGDFAGYDGFNYLLNGSTAGYAQVWVNAPPVFTAPLNFEAHEDDLFVQLELPCSDPGGTSIRLSWTDPGSNLVITYTTGCSLNFYPAPGFSGAVDFDVTATDEFGASVTAPFHLDVLPVDDAPLAVTDGLYTGGYSWKTGGPGYAWEDISQPENMLPLDEITGLVEKPLGFDFPVLDIGGAGRAASLAVGEKGLTLFGAEHNPLATASHTSAFMTGLHPTDSHVYLATLQNPARTVVTYENLKVMNFPSLGQVTLQWVLYPSGRLILQIENQYSGLGLISLSGPGGLMQAIDGAAVTARSVIEFVPDQWTISRTGSLQIPNSRLTANDFDIENAALLALPCLDDDSACTAPSRGTWAADPQTHTFTYTPNAELPDIDALTDTVSYGLTDDPAEPYPTVGQAVILIDTPLVVDPLHIRYPHDAKTVPGSLPVSNLETGEALSFGLARQPQHGALTIHETTGAFVYTPAAGWQGSDEFDFWAYDQDGQFVSGTVSLARNHAPVAGSNTFKLGCDKAFAGKLDISDPDAGDRLTLLVTQQPAHGTLAMTADGDFTYTPAAGYAGADSFTVTAADELGAVTEFEVTLTVEEIEVSLFLPLIGWKK